MNFVNPISPALHPIPANCPLCGEPQFGPGGAIDRGSGEGIEDLRLGPPHPEEGPTQWTVCHVECKYLFRDAVVNRLVELGRIEDGSDQQLAEYELLHDAIRNAIMETDHPMDRLIVEVGIGWMKQE